MVLLVVVDYGCCCAGTSCESGFIAETALSSLDESDVALYRLRVVGGRAAAVGHEYDVAIDRFVVLGRWCQAHGSGVGNDLVCENKTRLIDVAGVGWERLLRDVVVAA
jgi:hypothetical protein